MKPDRSLRKMETNGNENACLVSNFRKSRFRSVSRFPFEETKTRISFPFSFPFVSRFPCIGAKRETRIANPDFKSDLAERAFLTKEAGLIGAKAGVSNSDAGRARDGVGNADTLGSKGPISDRTVSESRDGVTAGYAIDANQRPARGACVEGRALQGIIRFETAVLPRPAAGLVRKFRTMVSRFETGVFHATPPGKESLQNNAARSVQPQRVNFE